MVRTKAAATKAVGAKAPRKNPPQRSVTPSNKKSKGKSYGGNFACPKQPTPSWQKGINNFFPNTPTSTVTSGALNDASSSSSAISEETQK